jgi:hypothetical protein
VANNEPVFSEEQILLVLKASGLDPDRPITEQIEGENQVSEAKVRDWISEAFEEREREQAQQSETLDEAQAEGQRIFDRMKTEGIGPFSWSNPSGDDNEAA